MWPRALSGWAACVQCCTSLLMEKHCDGCDNFQKSWSINAVTNLNQKLVTESEENSHVPEGGALALCYQNQHAVYFECCLCWHYSKTKLKIKHVGFDGTIHKHLLMEHGHMAPALLQCSSFPLFVILSVCLQKYKHTALFDLTQA